MKARGYVLGTLASVAVHALALTLLALAWRADFQRRNLSTAHTPIPVWLVEDKKAAPTDIVVPASGPRAPPVIPDSPVQQISAKPQRPRAPEPVRESASEPAVQQPADTASIPPVTRAASPDSPIQDETQPRSRDDVATGQPSPEPASTNAGKITDAPIEREYRALSRPEPAYPHQALARGIEGYVVLEFTVTAAGTTRDLRVLEASPTDVFDAAALAAVRQFRYQPRIQAGAPVDVPGVRSRIRFQIRPR
ncbi:MAG: energy transducer TonB [Porticoccaceae bacterium]